MNRSQCAFACGARTLQHAQRHRTHRLVDGGREDPIAIVHEHAIGAVKREAFSKLLNRPFSCGMYGDVPVQDPESRCPESRTRRRAERWRSRPQRSRRPARRRYGGEEMSPRAASADRCRGDVPTWHVAANRTRRQVRPSLTRSSAAIRSSAHVRFAAAMSAMSCWSSVGIGGRPRRLGVPLSVGSTSCGVQQREDDGRHETRPSDNSYNLNRLDAYGVCESHS